MTKYLIITLIISFTMQTDPTLIYNFHKESSLKNWQIVNDGVMGGLSKSNLEVTENGHGKFSGQVSLANNGGFASVRLQTDVEVDNNNQELILKIKGDGKTYQCRVKSNKYQRESYVHEFETTGQWQEIKLKLKDFEPQFRGRQLNKPNFDFSSIQEFSLLIANKKEEDFTLLIDSISLK